MPRRLVTKKFLVPFIIVLAIVFAEGMLRLVGLHAWRYRDPVPERPRMHSPDLVLGWRNKAGAHVVPPFHPSGSSIKVTLYEDGRRKAGESVRGPKGEIVVVGGSFTRGQAVSDHETYSWKVQQRYPSLQVMNYGTAGYGSYQSLLVLERQLPRMTSPKLVLYGFVDHHEDRNVAPEAWLRALTQTSRRAGVEVPFLTLDKRGQMLRHPPEGYSLLPLVESFAMVNLVGRVYNKTRTYGRYRQRRSLTEATILQMDRIGRKHGAVLIVALLRADDETKSHYSAFLERNGIVFVDCAYPITEEMQVPGDGHPNGKMHEKWARQIFKALDVYLNDDPPAGMSRTEDSVESVTEP